MGESIALDEEIVFAKRNFDQCTVRKLCYVVLAGTRGPPLTCMVVTIKSRDDQQ
jgi:hypothetical protein